MTTVPVELSLKNTCEAGDLRVCTPYVATPKATNLGVVTSVIVTTHSVGPQDMVLFFDKDSIAYGDIDYLRKTYNIRPMRKDEHVKFFGNA